MRSGPTSLSVKHFEYEFLNYSNAHAAILYVNFDFVYRVKIDHRVCKQIFVLLT